ncbi:hypothetical protein B7990_06995 [Fibrobacter sp. UWB4]|uniref:TIGR02171 family lipoprotein n=1 Tax=Fibrobacter sp. UWB4 TaxID=1964356 RepID=UPI000B52467E|nr:TIGR02171 family protein [Fibrobacter sp. UWB4]OWV18256.1 hypothetical protein B7990_06995 [Fibrobacter sp. UWB4]
MVKYLSTYIAIICTLVACSDNPGSTANDPSNKTPESHAGMILVEGSKKAITLGTNKKGAKESETPELKAILNYDYFMDATEVTCNEFKKVMKGEKIAKAIDCDKDGPVTDITFFDAVLFANKKSKNESLDSVYEYSSATFDDEGHCTNLSGFIYDADSKGYRLPTEAEWVKAATSSYKFKDFSGKLIEWTNDYLGKLKDTTIVNFAGAKNSNDLGERVVKGYNSDSGKLNLYSRGDVYTVTSASHADYIGFRLALGAIPEATWLDNQGRVLESPVLLLAKTGDLWDYTKTTGMKLVFRNDITGNLAYIDYAKDESSIIEIVDTISAYHPDISPDGKKVAFCTGLEGLTNQSSLYVRNLDSAGSKLIKLDVKSAAIPRWDVLKNGDTVITYVSNPGNNKDNDAFQSYSTWQVPFANGKFGTPKKLFNGAYHGGISEDENLSVTGAKLLRARVKGKDTIWYNKEQACNASLAKDSSKRTAFLDFAGKTGKDFIGKDYATHQYILIADSTGKLKQYIQAPTGYTFDHSEWAVGETNDNMVATLVNSSGAHKRISLMNLAKNKNIDLAEGEELWHPCFWIKKKTARDDNDFVFDPDSAGMYYNTSGACPNAIVFRYKMELLWQFKDSSNTVIIGSSRSYFGINPLLFNKEITAVNLSVSSSSIIGNSTLFYDYILPHYKKLKLLITSVDLDRGHYPGTTKDNIFYDSYKSYPGYVYDKNHDFWVGKETDRLYKATFNSPGAPKYASALRPNRGFYPQSSNQWGSPIFVMDSNWINWESSRTVFEGKIETFEKLLQKCNEEKITVIGVITPQNPAYKETGAFGRHGLLRSAVPKYMKILDDFMEKYPNFILVDENKMGDHDYTDEMAMDADHLSELGAAKLTHRLDSLIQTLDINWK